MTSSALSAAASKRYARRRGVNRTPCVDTCSASRCGPVYVNGTAPASYRRRDIVIPATTQVDSDDGGTTLATCRLATPRDTSPLHGRPPDTRDSSPRRTCWRNSPARSPRASGSESLQDCVRLRAPVDHVTMSSGSESSLPATPRHHVTPPPVPLLSLRSCSVDPVASDSSPSSSRMLSSSRVGSSRVSPSDIIRLADDKLRRQRPAARRRIVLMTLGKTSGRPARTRPGPGRDPASTRPGLYQDQRQTGHVQRHDRLCRYGPDGRTLTTEPESEAKSERC